MCIVMAALQNTQHVSEFSPDGKLFALISAEGKLKIWDTESNALKQDYTPNLHLSAPCTCMTWITVQPGSKSKSKKARKSIDHSEQSLYIALGTIQGGVALYSYATGKIEQYLKGNGHVGSVTGICRGISDLLYTCSEDGKIVVWDLSTAKESNSWNAHDKPTSLLYIPKSGDLLVGSRELKLWSTDTFELKQTFTGHTSNVILLRNIQINGNEFVLSASKMDRTISLWRIKNSSKYKNAVATFLMADVAFSISCNVDEDGTLQLAAVTRNGVAHVFIVDDALNSLSTKPIKPKVTIEVASDADKIVKPIPIVTSQLSLNNRKPSILLGYGDRQFLRFELIECNISERNQVLIRNDPKKFIGKASTDSNKLKIITPIVDNTVEYQTPAAIARKTKTIEIPMETRLENLTLGTVEAPFTKNVAQLLIQGLHNHDSSVLRSVFSNVDEKVIRLTLQRLPPQYVGNLVHELTLLSLQKTSNVQIAIIWLRILLQTHASQLMALGTSELFEKFGPIIGIIEHKANTYKPLSRLHGRLDLLCSQLKQNTDDSTIDNENVLVFEDKDTSESSEEEMNESGSSDGQWEQEDSEGEEDKMEVSDEEQDD